MSDWSTFRSEHDLKVGDHVTIGPLDDEGITFFQACGFEVEDRIAKAVITTTGVSQKHKRKR